MGGPQQGWGQQPEDGQPGRPGSNPQLDQTMIGPTSGGTPPPYQPGTGGYQTGGYQQYGQQPGYAPGAQQGYGEQGYGAPGQGYGGAQPGYGQQPAYGPPPGYPPQAPPPSGRGGPKVGLIIGVTAAVVLLIAVAVGAYLFTSSGDDAKTAGDTSTLPSSSGQASDSSAQPGRPTSAGGCPVQSSGLTFEITGTGAARGNVIYNLTSRQEEEVPLPWCKNFPLEGGYVYMVASVRPAGSGGSVTCKIYKNGTVVSVKSGAVVSCNTTTN